MEKALSRIRSIADYQFGQGIGTKLFPENVDIGYSKTTGRIRYVHLKDKRLATLRPSDGLLSLSIPSARLVAENRSFARCFVTVQNDVSEFIAKGSDVFSRHVVRADEIHAKDEVIVVSENNRVLAVGRALLSSSEMMAFKTGVAVKIRRGCKNES